MSARCMLHRKKRETMLQSSVHCLNRGTHSGGSRLDSQQWHPLPDLVFVGSQSLSGKFTYSTTITKYQLPS
jgi:hypothetical protein